MKEKEEHLINLQISKIIKEIEKLDLEKENLKHDSRNKLAQLLITLGTIATAIAGFIAYFVSNFN